MYILSIIMTELVNTHLSGFSCRGGCWAP